MLGPRGENLLSFVLCVFMVLALPSCNRGGTGEAQPGGKSATSQPAAYRGWPFDGSEATRRRAETARALNAPEEVVLDLGGKVTMKMILVPAGEFVMGSPVAEPGRDQDEGPQRKVTITRAFYMGIHPVTRGQFGAYVKDTGYKTVAEKRGGARVWDGQSEDRYVKGASWREVGFPQNDDCAVVLIAYDDAVAFCHWLSKRSGRSITLPTEAEWEYSCRAGTTTLYQWGTDPNDGIAWCSEYSWAYQVGRLKANNFGLHDMVGNVWQWCTDWYGCDYYASAAATDPTGPPSGTTRVTRGCAPFTRSSPPHARSALRWGSEPDAHHEPYTGFRVVCRIP